MTNEERARAWITDTHLERCVVDSEVKTLVMHLDVVRQEALDEAARLVRGLQGAHGLIFQEAAADCIEKLAAK